MGGTHYPWRTWLWAVHQLLQNPRGTSALTMACQVKTDEKTLPHTTSVRIMHGIFEGLTEARRQPTSDIIEVDDTLIGYVNGVPVNVIGLWEDGTRLVRARVVVGDINQDIATDFIRSEAKKDVTLFTDGATNYPLFIWRRYKVIHKHGEYVRWEEDIQRYVMTNHIENFWRTLKATLWIHQSVTLEHLHLYIAAAVWHHNHLGVPVLDQMRKFVRNAHSVRVRPVEWIGIDEDALDFQLDIQLPWEPKELPEAA